MIKRFAFICLGWTAAASTAVAQTQSWPIMCRSGGGMTLSVQQEMDNLRSIPCGWFGGAYNIPCPNVGSGAEVSYGFKNPPGGIPRYLNAELTLSFEGAPQGANTALPGPGQCAFLDRPIVSSGQRGAVTVRMTQNMGNPSFISRIETDAEGRIVNLTPGGGTSARPIVEFLFARWRAKEQLFTVYGYSDGRPNTMILTGFEPTASGPN